jgi:tetratricopeptide (TPR) repeat protein
MSMRIAMLAMAAAVAWGQSPAFELSVSVNGSGGGRIYRGQPVLVETVLMLTEGEKGKIDLKGGAEWTSALTLELSKGGEGAGVEWVRLGAAENPLLFTEDAPEAAALLGLGGEATLALEPGEYVLRATLDTQERAAGDAWAGVARSREVRLLIADEPEQLDETEALLGKRLRARWLLLTGRAEDALGELDAALEGSPEDIDLLTDKADALVELGRREEAQGVLEKAIGVFRKQNPRGSHPPRDLLRRLRELNEY